jgi:hypothetical protein
VLTKRYDDGPTLPTTAKRLLGSHRRPYCFSGLAQFLERREDPAVHRGVACTEQRVELAEPVGDRVQDGRLQGAGGLADGEGVLGSREGRLSAAGQRVLQVLAFVLLGGGVDAGVVLHHVEEL